MIPFPLSRLAPLPHRLGRRPRHDADPGLRATREPDATGRWLETPLPHEVRSRWTKWTVTLLVTAAAVAVRFVMDPWVHEELPLSTIYGAVAVVVWFAGPGPAVAAAVLGFVACDYLFIAPRFGSWPSLEEVNDFLLFLTAAGLTIAIGARMRSAQALARENGRIALERQRSAESALADLRQTQAKLHDAQRQIQAYAEGLEKIVADRTARLQEMVYELEAFSYSIAHDMRAPLRSMVGYSELIRQEHADGLDRDAREYLGRIAASARRLDHLIQDVLDYSRIVREELPLTTVDPRALVLEVLESYPHLAAFKERVAVGEIPLLWANRAALTQVVSNLLANAVKFVRPGVTPSVRVFAGPAEPPRAGAPGSWVRVSIEDNGIGIDASVIPRLFEMFHRFTRPGLYEGTGMGLAIARKAVDRMGGAIGVESAVGEGSRFWFVLPCAETAARAGTASSS